MNIKLIRPRYKTHLITPPLSLGYLASYLKSQGYNAEIIDGLNMNLSNDQIVNIIKKDDIVCITCMSAIMPEVIDLCKRLDNFIVLGGPHASCLPEDTLAMTGADCCIVGEGEISLYKLIRHLETDNEITGIPGVYTCKENFTERPFIKDLDTLPYPDWSQMDPRTYQKAPHGAFIKNFPIAPITSSRGCPYNCTFCLLPDQKVFVDKQYVPIKDIFDYHLKTPQFVLTHKGNYKQINDVMKRDYDGEIISIHPYHLDTPLKLTPNHKIWVIKQKDILCKFQKYKTCVPQRRSSTKSIREYNKNKWVPVQCSGCAFKRTIIPQLVQAREISKGDYIITPINTHNKDISHIDLYTLLQGITIRTKNGFQKWDDDMINQVILLGEQGYSTRKIAKITGVSKSYISRLLNHKRQAYSDYTINTDGLNVWFPNALKKVPKMISLDEDFCRLIGYYLAEGNTHFLKTRPNSAVMVLTFNQSEKHLIDDAAQLIYKHFNIHPRLAQNNFNHTIQITTANAVVAHTFKILFGPGSLKKHIPIEYISLPKSKIEQIVKGWLVGDGGYDYNHKVKLTGGYKACTSSSKLKEDMKSLLSKLNIIFSLHQVHPKDTQRRIKRKNISYVFDIKNFDNIQYLSNIGIKPKYPYKCEERPTIRTQGFVIADKFIAHKIKDISTGSYCGEVYNLSVDDDASYVANDIAVSNCASPKLWKRTIRFRSPKNIVDEIEMLVKDFGVKEIHFEDDNLTMKREHIVEICDRIITRDFKVSIACPNGVRTDKIDRELLQLMKQAGFYYLAFGIESGNADILNNVKKHTDPESQLKAIAMAEEEGFMTQGFFIFGLPGETKETIQETITYAKKSKLSRAQFLLLDVFPGSELYDLNCKAYDYSKESYHEVTWCPPTIDLKTLQDAPSKAFRSFFLRPRQIWSLIKYFKFEQLPFLLKRLKDFKVIK